MLLCAVFPLRALDPDKAFPHYVVNRWSIEQGLPQISVLSIAQDDTGYLWVGTQSGLARFDGVRFVIDPPPVPPVLPGIQVRALLNDSDGRLWIGTYRGLAVRERGKVRTIAAAGYSALDVHALLETREGILVFEARATEVLGDPAQPPLALAYLDLDNLKLVNDTASHRAGDALIVAVAQALRARLTPDDVLGHYGGDEFVVLMRNCSAAVARERATALLGAVSGCACAFEGRALSTTASIGLVPFQPDELGLSEALSQADAACFSAKEDGGNRIRIAGTRSGTLADPTSAMRWTVRIRQALAEDGFLLYAQSIAPLASELPAGRNFELLLRMRADSSGGIHLPDQFLPAAERFHLGVPIDRRVVDSALAWLEQHPEAAARTGTCAINLGGAALADEGFIAFLGERLRRSEVAASRLCFEITETSAVRDLPRAQRFISEMRGLGCRFALDDFGTGFCSFGYVRQLDVDYFKIDGSFVREMDTSPVALEVVRSITRIAHVLGRRTIAEHTETAAQREALHLLGVDYAQGYAIDRPQPLAQYLAIA